MDNQNSPLEFWENHVLVSEGLFDWKIRYKSDGYCWKNDKTIQTIEGDRALFLHEVAHALVETRAHGDQHHSIWGHKYTDLVRRYLVKSIVRMEDTLRFIQRDHFNPLNNRCSVCARRIEEAFCLAEGAE